MNDPLRRIRRGAVVLAVLLSLSVLGYRLSGRDWLDSLYMVVITIATIGYGEHSQLAPAEKAFTIVVIVLGLSAAAYTIGGFLQMVAEGEIDRALGVRRQVRGIAQLRGHVVVCGFGRMGQMLAQELARRKTEFVVIDRSVDRVAHARELGYLAMDGDATEETVLRAAQVEMAKTIVTALPNDAENVFITLTARDLNLKLQIIARGEFPSTHKKLVQAGADRVILPAAIGAMRIAAMITRPSTVELMELVSGRSVMNVEVDELVLPENCPLLDKSVAETEARRKHGLLVVAVKRADGNMVFNPDADFRFAARDTVIVMGPPESIERFRVENALD